MSIELTKEDRDGGLPSLSEKLNNLSNAEIQDIQIQKLREIMASDPEKAKRLAEKLDISINLL